MIEVTSFKGKTVGVFGLARSGLSAIRSLKAGGATVFAWDDKESTRLMAAGEGARPEPWERWPWRKMAALILSPGVPLTHPQPHAVGAQQPGLSEARCTDAAIAPYLSRTACWMSDMVVSPRICVNEYVKSRHS